MSFCRPDEVPNFFAGLALMVVRVRLAIKRHWMLAVAAVHLSLAKVFWVLGLRPGFAALSISFAVVMAIAWFTTRRSRP